MTETSKDNYTYHLLQFCHNYDYHTLHAYPLANLFQYKNHGFIKTTTVCVTLSVFNIQPNFNYSYYDIQLDSYLTVEFS